MHTIAFIGKDVKPLIDDVYQKDICDLLPQSDTSILLSRYV